MKNLKKTHLAGAISFLILLSIGSGMLFISWRRWPDILVDFGWELYTSWQVSHGMVLYEGMKLAVMGPLSFYVNATLFRIFGVGLTTIVYFNIFIIAILTLLIYRIFIRNTDRLSATLSCAAFLGIFAFSQYLGTGNYNFVCPYTHQLTHGILLSFLAIYLFDIYQENMSKPLFFLEGIIIGLIFLTKIEVFIAIFTAITIGISFLIFTRKTALQNIFKMLSLFGIGFLLPISGFTVYFAKYMPLWESINYIVMPYKTLFISPIASNIFYRRISGIDFPVQNILKMLYYGLNYLVVFLSITLTGKMLSLIPGKRLKAATAVCLAVLIYILAPYVIHKIPWFEISRGIPIAVIMLGAYFCFSAFRFKNNGAKARQNLTLFVISIFSFMILIKIILNVHVYHYGFALAMPGALLLTASLACYAPTFSRNQSFEAFFIRALTVIVVGVTIMVHVVTSARMYSIKTYPISEGADTMLTYSTSISPVGPCINDAIGEIRKLIREDETLLVLPEGIMFNYLSRRVNPFPYISFMPFEQETIGEDKILGAMVTSSPDYIILIDRDMTEFGYKGFGVDYGLNVFAWIKENYKLFKKISSFPIQGRSFNIFICKRIKTNK